jgi:hypothetical protein
MQIDPHASTSKAKLSSQRVTTERRSSVRAAAAVKAETEDEDLRAYKKRMTSTETGDEDLREAEAQFANVDENVGEPVGEVDNWDQGWDDLDAEDADAQMVSEYVAEILEHLKEVEVRFLSSRALFRPADPWIFS